MSATIVAEILTNHFDEIERVLLRRIGFGEKSQGFVEKRSKEISTRRREIFIRSGLVEQKTAGNI